MARRPKDIGTEYETKITRELQALLPGMDITRTPAASASWDIRGLDWPVECKVRKTWSIPAWVRKIRKISTDWVIFVSDRDLRRTDSPGEVVVINKELFYQLISTYLQETDNDQGTG